MFRKVLLALAVFAGGLVGFAQLVGIGRADISMMHAMERHVGHDTFKAGDIISISADGLSIKSHLCQVNLEKTQRTEVPVDAIYYNVVDAAQEKFQMFMHGAKVTFGLPSTPPVTDTLAADKLHFRGEVSRVVGDTIAGSMMNTTCVCNVAMAIVNERAKACVVEKSLLETKLVETPSGHILQKVTMGVSLKPQGITFSDLDALAEICPSLNTRARIAQEVQCGGTKGYKFDVMARSKIGLIRASSAAQ